MFKGRKLLIATKHQKEKVIIPLIEKELGVQCVVPDNFDSDFFGTFTGEIERKANALTTARNKCLQAMELYNCDLAIANEGSFGAHPTIFFVPADDELMILIDTKNDLEIVAREISVETNFNGKEINTEKMLIDFANQAKFPSHSLIVRKSKNDNLDIVKGIEDWEQLCTIFNQFIEKYGVAYIETDMRAMNNPTRMSVIQKATEKLLDKIKSCCPQCETPGFGISSTKEGLPCNLCGYPTRSTLSYIYSCNKCTFAKEEMYPHKKHHEDPTYCDRCNP